ncbi:MAG: hypothetical protein AAGJ10_16445 [Bacteroidota bacterium]
MQQGRFPNASWAVDVEHARRPVGLSQQLLEQHTFCMAAYKVPLQDGTNVVFKRHWQRARMRGTLKTYSNKVVQGQDIA